jgi:ATP-dependent 26S proteasome regulatory subunit
MIKDVSKEVSEKALQEMCNDEFKGDFSNMLRSRYPLFYITTNEESRLIQFLEHYCIAKGYDCYLWDTYYGLIDIKTKKPVGGATDELKANPLAALDYIIGESKNYEDKRDSVKVKKDDKINGVIYVLLDFFRFITDDPDYERRLRAVADISSIVSTIITGPYYHTTDVLSNLIPVLDFPFANRKEIGHALTDIAMGASFDIPDIVKKTKDMKEELIDAVSGLTLLEGQSAYSKSLVAHRDWKISTILKEKKQIISKSGILEYFDKPVSMDDVGGLKNLINWINDRKTTFSDSAAEYGLKKPRGLLTIGMPGCGKSLVCKAISSAWKMPLLRLDFGRLFGSLVGKSEENARSAIKLAEAVAPAILWIDEIEKAISGGASSGRSDGGTTSRVLSTFLTWMQEKTSAVFVVATANDHQSIPPEFLRAGRFDEIFFVDLPNKTEREEIFKVLLRLRGLDHTDFKLAQLAGVSENYSGAEIEKGIDNAMLAGFMDNKRKINTDDVVKALGEFKTLFDMRKSDFEGLREWADSQCIKANEEYKETVSHGLDKTVDLDFD